LAAGLLTGCFQGPGATTTMQALQPTGNGVQAVVGGLRIENATLVTNDTTTSLVTRIYNDGSDDDILLAVTINGERVAVSPATPLIAAGANIAFGFPDLSGPNIQTEPLPMSEFIPVTLTFQQAGSVDLSALTVPPTGIYEGLLG
jgi:hypothetical protein